ncbi:MAG TPA: hypothetical protein VF458_05840 [Ktedonobacteraceae bacterium]
MQAYTGASDDEVIIIGVYLVVGALMVISLVLMFWLPGGRADDLKYKGDDEDITEERGVDAEVSLIG